MLLQVLLTLEFFGGLALYALMYIGFDRFDKWATKRWPPLRPDGTATWFFWSPTLPWNGPPEDNIFKKEFWQAVRHKWGLVFKRNTP